MILQKVDALIPKTFDSDNPEANYIITKSIVKH